MAWVIMRNCDNFCDIKENILIRKKLRELGICRIIWPTRPGGETGPKGELNGLSAYGVRYSVSTQQFNVTANRKTIIPLETTGQYFFR